MIYIKNVLKIFPFFLIIIFGVSFLIYSQKKINSQSDKEIPVQTTVTYCSLYLSDKWKLGNLSFNSLYSFSINNKGEIINIKKIRDNFIGEDSVKSCLEKWKFLGFPENSQFSVYFVWQHGKGWVRQEIKGKGFTQVMTLENAEVELIVNPQNTEKP